MFAQRMTLVALLLSPDLSAASEKPRLAILELTTSRDVDPALARALTAVEPRRVSCLRGFA